MTPYEQHMNDLLPEEPYMVVFGTSHTYGSCVQGERIDLDYDEIWASIVAKKMGLKIVNLAVPGNSNKFIIQQIFDFLRLEKSKNCKLAVVEVRIAEQMVLVSNDLRNIAITDMFPEIILPELSVGKDVRKLLPVHFDKATLSSLVMSRIPIISNAEKRLQLIINSIKNKMFGIKYPDDKPRDVDQNLANAIKYRSDNFIELESGTLLQYLMDYYDIRVMMDALKLSNIPARWFCFDSHMYGEMNLTKYDYLMTKIATAVDVINYRIKSLKIGGTRTYYSEYGQHPPQCECGHSNEIFHRWLAEKVYEDIKEENL